MRNLVGIVYLFGLGSFLNLLTRFEIRMVLLFSRDSSMIVRAGRCFMFPVELKVGLTSTLSKLCNGVCLATHWEVSRRSVV